MDAKELMREVEELNEVVAEQQRTIDTLRCQVTALGSANEAFKGMALTAKDNTYLRKRVSLLAESLTAKEQRIRELEAELAKYDKSYAPMEQLLSDKMAEIAALKAKIAASPRVWMLPDRSWIGFTRPEDPENWLQCYVLPHNTSEETK